MLTLTHLSDGELLARLPKARADERTAIAHMIAYLAEVDRRRLHLREACSSLLSFCLERLGYSENEAQKRIQVARLYQRLPQVLAELENGSIHLTGLFLLFGAPHRRERDLFARGSAGPDEAGDRSDDRQMVSAFRRAPDDNSAIFARQ